MATRTLYFDGQLVSTPASVTISVNDTQVFSGAVGEGAEMDTDITLATATVETADQEETTATVSISATSGIVRIGAILADFAGYAGLTAEQQADIGPLLNDANDAYNYGTDYRSNILIDGSAPDWPEPGTTPMPRGTEESPDWTGWRFEISAGETFSCTVTIPKQIK